MEDNQNLVIKDNIDYHRIINLQKQKIVTTNNKN